MKEQEPPSILIVSGGVGATGEQLVHTVLAQFPDSRVDVVVIGHVRQPAKIEEVVAQAKERSAIVVHTLVDPHLRRLLVERAREQGVTAIDLMGELLACLGEALHRQPTGQPGLYRHLHKAYFDRVEAIEYTIAHDDGRNPEGWQMADIVLTGVSRVGKTPLSIYLSVLGWKVANVPLISGLPVSPELFDVDRRRVVGLLMEAGQLLVYRQQRQQRLGVVGKSAYDDPPEVHQEMTAARRLFRRHGFGIVDVTDKPIETSAEEIVSLVTRRLQHVQTVG